MGEFSEIIKKHKIAFSILSFFIVTFLIILIMSTAYFLIGIRKPSIISVQTKTFGVESMRKVYPDFNDEEREILLVERSSLYVEYEAFTGYREKEFHGKYVNISPYGFRYKDNFIWPPPSNKTIVFTFGGSTLFGYGLPDNQTIPFFIEEKLKLKNSDVVVYNFGRAGYFSTQERILFEKLISSGIIPNIAVFFDGLNDFYHLDGLPSFFEDNFNFVNDQNKRVFESSFTASKFKIKDKVTPFEPYDKKNIEGNVVKEKLMGVIDNYIANVNIINVISKKFKIKTFFFWQPIPIYKNSEDSNLFIKYLDKKHLNSKDGYTLFQDLIIKKKVILPLNFFWLADIQENREGIIYLDTVHYTAFFSRVISEIIVCELNKQQYSK